MAEDQAPALTRVDVSNEAVENWAIAAESSHMPSLAATLRALLSRAEAAEAERDALRARVEWWQTDSAAGWNKCEERRLQAEKAEAALATARREAAEAMREKAAEIAQLWLDSFGAYPLEHVTPNEWANGAVADIRDAIRTLPLPGDEA